MDNQQSSEIAIARDRFGQTSGLYRQPHCGVLIMLAGRGGGVGTRAWKEVSKISVSQTGNSVVSALGGNTEATAPMFMSELSTSCEGTDRPTGAGESSSDKGVGSALCEWHAPEGSLWGATAGSLCACATGSAKTKCARACGCPGVASAPKQIVGSTNAYKPAKKRCRNLHQKPNR